MDCPVCSSPACGLETLIENVSATDYNLLVSLACDFADHVAQRAKNPDQATEWLEVARAWSTSPEQVRGALDAAWEVVTNQGSRNTQEKADTAVWTAIEAAAAAAQGKEARPVAAWTRSCAQWAIAAMGKGRGQEAAWQLNHIRRLACTCQIKVDPIGSRSRNSLLAS